MSNHLAIATVTATLARLLTAAAQTGVAQATARLGPPDLQTGQDGKPLVNLFLYQAAPNAQLRNAHMPGRRPDGSPANRSRVALDLRYIVSFYGDAAKFEPERMMGAVAVALEDQPIFSAELVRRAVADNPATLLGSDLETALSAVRISPESQSLDDLSKLWSIFFQVPYALSAAYLCSHVSIETGDEAQPALPAAAARIYAAPTSRSAIEEVRAAEGPSAPILWGGTVILRGQRLNASGLLLRIAGHDVILNPGEATAQEIALKLEAPRFGGAELPAGFHTVQTVTPPPAGGPAHLARVTEGQVFALRPKVSVLDTDIAATSTPEAAEGELTIGFSPAIAEGQSVRLMLDERTATDPQGVTLAPNAVEPDDFPAAQLIFPFAGLRRAKFLVRAQVEGVDSAADLDSTAGSPTFGQIIGPEVDLA